MTNNTPIILLHGLGAHTITLLPLELYLNHIGYNNTHRLPYPVDKMDLDESVDYVDQEIMKLVDKNTSEIILIGQSMGGLVANRLHTKNWKIKMAVYIGSPLHGARLLNQLENVLPTTVRNYFYKKPYSVLQEKTPESEPPHNYHTISCGWFNSNFDGCVYQDEVILNEKHHTHLQFADHRTIFANPRLWHFVGKLLDDKNEVTDSNKKPHFYIEEGKCDLCQIEQKVMIYTDELKNYRSYCLECVVGKFSEESDE